MRVIPALDLIDKRVVRLKQGDYDQCTFYPKSPLEYAQAYEAAGATHLHLVDLEGAKAQSPVHLDVLAEIKAKTQLHVDFGGGIKSLQSVEQVFAAGADQLTLGSLAAQNPDLALEILSQYGPERIIIGLDVKGGKVAINGWKETMDGKPEDLLERFVAAGLNYVIATDISRDGMLGGAAVKWYQQLQSQFPDLKFIASGGVGSANDLQDLRQAALYGVVVGKAFLEGKIDFKTLESWS